MDALTLAATARARAVAALSVHVVPLVLWLVPLICAATSRIIVVELTEGLVPAICGVARIVAVDVL